MLLTLLGRALDTLAILGENIESMDSSRQDFYKLSPRATNSAPLPSPFAALARALGENSKSSDQNCQEIQNLKSVRARIKSNSVVGR